MTRFLKRSVAVEMISITMAGLVMMMGSTAHAKSVKSLPASFRGCGPAVSEAKARSLMKQYNLTTTTGTSAEVRAIGKSLNWITTLNGGSTFSLSRGPGRKPYPWNFVAGHGDSGQRPNGFRITRKSGNNGSNVTQLTHEMGHLVGNNGGYTMYRKYMKGASCYPSTYARSRFNEQFAEVFAAFVGNPSQLKGKGAGCDKAYKFMRDKLFKNGEAYAGCNQRADILEEAPEVQHADGQDFIQEPLASGQGVS